MPQHRPTPQLIIAVLLGLLLSNGAPLLAQGRQAVPQAAIGSEGERRLRLQGLIGDSLHSVELLRSSASGIDAISSRHRRARATRHDTLVLLAPELFFTSNSAHAWGFNDGLLSAGRGANALLTAGLAVRTGRFSAVFIPQLAYEANERFQTIPFPRSLRRDMWSNPFYDGTTSLDYPQRFGSKSRQTGVLQSRIALDITRGIRFGIGNENRWWGPALEQPLLLGSNAPPFQQLFIESDGPLETRAGRFEYQFVLGGLRESEYFDSDTLNDLRSLSALAVTWHPGGATSRWPSVGFSRGVISRRSPGIYSALDVFRNVGRPWSRLADTVQARDQITTLFFRWHVPEKGFDLYAEWARFEQPANLRDFLQQPGHSQGYTLGGQWARPWRDGLLHLRSEFSYLEPSTSIRVRPVSTTYTSASVPHGWTNEGQMLGPGIGPGSSVQTASGDYHGPRWRIGGSLGRWRRDANYRLLFPLPFKREDLQLYGSLRVGRDIGPVSALFEFTNGVRLNHLYQAYELPGTSGNDTEGVDLLNRTVTLTLTPRFAPAAR